MKYISALFAVLAIVSLGQAHQFPDFGSGSLHEDIQDILDLVPAREIKEIVTEYILKDPEVLAALNDLRISTILKDLIVDLKAIPEVINLMNYMQNEGIDINSLINEINEALDIEQLPPASHSYSATQRTGGILGLFKDIRKVIPFHKFIRSYVQKMRTSSAFIGFINQLKSYNFQQVVNKVYQIKSFQIIVNELKGVNSLLTTDIMYILLGITVPNDISVQRSLDDDFVDIFKSVSPNHIEKIGKLIYKYVTEDERVQSGVLYLFTKEFQSALRNTEALKEHRELVKYLQEAGLHVVEGINWFHEVIGMEDYVPPKMESIFESQIGIQEIGDGMKGLILDIYNVLPTDEIAAAYEEKLQTSKIFADFIEKIKSPELQKIIDDLYANQTFKDFVITSRGKGLEFKVLKDCITKIWHLKFPY